MKQELYELKNLISQAGTRSGDDVEAKERSEWDSEGSINQTSEYYENLQSRDRVQLKFCSNDDAHDIQRLRKREIKFYSKIQTHMTLIASKLMSKSI